MKQRVVGQCPASTFKRRLWLAVPNVVPTDALKKSQVGVNRQGGPWPDPALGLLGTARGGWVGRTAPTSPSYHPREAIPSFLDNLHFMSCVRSCVRVV